MRTIEIDDDIYEHLRQQQTTFSGETASQLLRKLLNLDSSKPDNRVSVERQPLSPATRTLINDLESKIDADERKKALWGFLKAPQFKAERNGVSRFLSLLGFLHDQNRERFAVVAGLNGRTRRYFAKSQSEIELSGNHVHPKKIPGSEYWVVTNNSSQSKCELLLQVMKMLDYEGGFAAFVATAALSTNRQTS